jgi:hypothetical protein
VSLLPAASAATAVKLQNLGTLEAIYAAAGEEGELDAVQAEIARLKAEMGL